MGFEGTTLWRVRRKVGTDLLLWPGASVTVVGDDGKVLLGRRLDNDLWAVPGGGAEEGSSFADTAITELRERWASGGPADLVACACISRVDNHLETYPNGDVTHYFGLWFVLRRWRGAPAPTARRWARSRGSTSTTRGRRCAQRALASSCTGRGSDPGGSRSTDRGSSPRRG